jgi:hypothetical protein
MNAELTEDVEFAEKRKGEEGSLHCAARRATNRRERKIRPLRSG